MEMKLAIPDNILRQAIIDGVKEAFAPVVPTIAEKLNALLPDAEPTEIATSGVKKMLMQKGYRVKSHQALMKVLGDHGIHGTFRGNQNWFPYSEVKRIAPK